ncbi:response regulator transcription factor (plasmid) [Streptomyces sp. NBC_01471]|uniref:helix-turn-helix transcriptional regulator n=1 Tax=Streptomyces sp. NBC_01471 TaxID=2903879 RepID=UPI002F90AE9F
MRLALVADDAITGEGARAYLSMINGLTVLPPELRGEADVILVLAGRFTTATMAELEAAARAAAHVPAVLVADSISQSHLLRAISHGLVGYLVRTRTTWEEAVRVVFDSRAGGTVFPDHMIRLLIDQTRAGLAHPSIAERDRLLMADLSARETEVLELFAEGLSTAEVARRLSYAERTIKTVLSGVLLRLNLRNRAHAVAYALRIGAI